jgi:streptogramin lyase
VFRGFALVVGLAAVAATSSAAHQRMSSAACGPAGVGKISKPSKPGPLDSRCARRVFKLGQTLYRGEQLESRGGTISFYLTDPAVPLKCNMPSGGRATLYPEVKTSSKERAVLTIESGSISCWATAGGEAERARKRQALFIYGDARIKVGASPRRTTAAPASQKAEDTLVGLKVTKGKLNVLVTKGAVRVGAATGTSSLVNGGQQRLLKPNGVSERRPSFDPRNPPDLKSAFLAVHPNICEKGVVIPSGAVGSHPQGLAKDRNGDLWFTDDGLKAVGRYDHTSETITIVPIPGLNQDSIPRWITSDVNRNIWFTDDSPTRPAIWMIDASTHSFTPYYMDEGSEPWAIEHDRTRNVFWLTDRATPAIWRFDPKTKTQPFTKFPVVAGQGMNPLRHPQGIAIDTKRNRIWFTDDNDRAPSGRPVPDPAIGMLNPTTGKITWYRKGLVKGSLPRGIAMGPDGNVWFTDQRTKPSAHDYARGDGDGLIGMLNPSSGKITEYAIFANGGNTGSFPHGLAADTKGNLWFTDAGTTPAIGLIDPKTGAIIEHPVGGYPMGILSTPDGLSFAVQFPRAKIATLVPKTSSC